jgi:HAMP domain-containing protein
MKKISSSLPLSPANMIVTITAATIAIILLASNSTIINAQQPLEQLEEQLENKRKNRRSQTED